MAAIGTLAIISYETSTTYYYKSEAPQIINPLESLDLEPTKSNIKMAVSFLSNQYGLNESQLFKVIECESGYNPDAIGDGGYAVGILQFHKSTFKQYCKGSYYSTKDQLTCAAKMWKAGQQRHWTCYVKNFGK